jgi:hypothetical protein
MLDDLPNNFVMVDREEAIGALGKSKKEMNSPYKTQRATTTKPKELKHSKTALRQDLEETKKKDSPSERIFEYQAQGERKQTIHTLDKKKDIYKPSIESEIRLQESQSTAALNAYDNDAA